MRKIGKKLVSGIISVSIILGFVSMPIRGGVNLFNSYADVRDYDNTKFDKWKKIGHVFDYWHIVGGYDLEKSEAAADILVKEDINGEINVTLTFNKDGAYDSFGKRYIRTSNPYYSFAISNGYSIVGEKTYALQGSPFYSNKADSENLMSQNDYFGSEQGNGEAFWGQTHTGITSINEEDKSIFYKHLLESGVDKRKIGYFERINYYSKHGKERATVITFKIRKNEKFEQGKEFILANYKSYDDSNLRVANTILRDTEVRKESRLEIGVEDNSLKLNLDYSRRSRESG